MLDHLIRYDSLDNLYLARESKISFRFETESTE